MTLRLVVRFPAVRPVLSAILVALVGCGKLARKTPPAQSEGEAPVVMGSAPTSVPPAAPFNATPAAVYADAGDFEGKTPLEQAQRYAANGQLWMARLVLEKQALSSSGTAEEVEFLGRICRDQADKACVDECSHKLGHAIKADGGTISARGKDGRDAPPDRLRDMLSKKQYGPVRQALEPKVLDGSASPEEIRLLKVVCAKQNDRMCVALCDSKLR